MKEQNPPRRKVDQFILDEIESVPHLEALLLLWKNRPRSWDTEDLARALYLQTDATRILLHNLQARGLARPGDSDQWFWNESSGRADLMTELEETYRRELVRISSMIHSKASPAVRQFARAFRLKKD